MDQNHSSTPMTNLVNSPIDEADEPVCPATGDEGQDMDNNQDPSPAKLLTSPIRVDSGIARSATMPDALSRFRKATRQVIAAGRFSSMHAAIQTLRVSGDAT